MEGAAEFGGLADGDGFGEDAEEEAAERVDWVGGGGYVDEVADAGGGGGGGLFGCGGEVAVFALGHFFEGLGPAVFLEGVDWI